jgi:hypothetical protein
MKRCSVERWKKEALQAASMTAGACAHGGTVGIDMVAQDGNTFAHGHFDIEIAEQFRDLLTEAIAEAKARAN